MGRAVKSTAKRVQPSKAQAEPRLESTQIDRRTGQPKKGKRANSDVYRQVSAWVRRDTHNAVTEWLFLNGRQEFSTFLQGLLEEWLRGLPKGKRRG